ncbi:TolC family outer membrane protein [Stutzerimonas azotifigens]|uniref:TolC family outer membrane protein n=1 Tax=Stutzerimonas azotifigens TaxID=291995 RepID=UPI00040B625D|nr:TolC family outer membrane protein [Stutzerimonas azotifigens]
MPWKHLLLAGLLGCASPARGLDLLEAYDLALFHDPAFQAAIQAHAAGQEERAIGRAGLLPSLSWSYSNSENDSEVRAGEATAERDYRSYASTLTLQQPLLDYEAWARYRQGVAQALLADEQYRAQGQELAVRLLTAYSQALLARERIELSRAQRRAYAERLQLNRRLFDKGEGTRTDILETEARHGLALAEEIEAQDSLDDALRVLQAMLGRSLAIDELAPLAEVFEPLPLQPAAFDSWRELALRNNPLLAAQRHGLSVSEHEVAQRRAGHLPKVSLYASSRKTSSDSESTYNQKYDTNSIGVQISLPLFAGGATSASVRQAARRLEQARHELDAQTAEALNELRRQYDLSRSSQARIRAYQLAVESAGLLTEATRRSVEGGERVNLDVLDAEQQLYGARRDLAEARHGWLLAWLKLRQGAGVLGAEDLQALARYFQPDR